MAKEMTRTLEPNISNLDKSVNTMCNGIQQVKSATQSLCTTMIQILHELSHIYGHSFATPHNRPPKDIGGSMQSTPE